MTETMREERGGEPGLEDGFRIASEDTEGEQAVNEHLVCVEMDRVPVRPGRYERLAFLLSSQRTAWSSEANGAVRTSCILRTSS
jgi:hypothetical protein